MEGSPSSAVSSALPARRAFPPQLAEVEELLGGDATSSASSSSQVKALRHWCDALLEQIAGVSRGPNTDAPVEEVWHWLAASERLTRSASFVEHSAVADLLARVSEHGGQEGTEVASRWHDAIGQLRVLQKESSWNAQYLRIVEEPLRQLESDEALYSGSLASVVRRLLRSLNHIFCSAENFKEHRMATLLSKILKELVKQAGRHLASPYEVGAPKAGFDVSLRSAQQLRDSFKAYLDHFFVSEPAAADKLPGLAGLERRPATALGTRGDRSHTVRRRDASDLGWWRATVRTSLTHAEHCSMVCHRISNLLSGCRWLSSVLPALRAADPLLLQQADSFLQLYGGVKGGGNMLALLDLKCQFDMLTRLQEVEEKLQSLIAQADSMGIPDLEDASLASVADNKGRTIVESGGSLAEVLTLPSAPELTEARASTAAGEPRECNELQKDIAGMREELRQFGSQLENLTDMARQKSARARLPFNPMPRASRAQPAGNEEEEAAASSKADHAAALEVAKRSTWYREPPSCIPKDVEVISVRQEIAFRPVNDGTQRPRTSQPCLLVTRPSTAPAGSLRDPASEEDRTSAIQQASLPEEELEDLEAEEDLSPAEGALVEEERADIQQQDGADPDGTLLETAAETEAVADLDEQDPFCVSAPSWRIA